jgi:8-oxo-dGTP pyrophosphatase MutT (NUDIX family)
MAGKVLKDGVVAILNDAAGRYLFIRRGLTLKRAPGWWCFVGGEVDAGESLPEAIAREVLEEVGLRVTVHDKVHESVSPNGEYLLHWYVTRLEPAGQEPVPSPEEVAELRWLGVADGLRLAPILPGLKAWLEQHSKGGDYSG